MKMEFTLMFPCVEVQESLMNARATWMISSIGIPPYERKTNGDTMKPPDDPLFLCLCRL
jgi:hypothetical protein